MKAENKLLNGGYFEDSNGNVFHFGRVEEMTHSAGYSVEVLDYAYKSNYKDFLPNYGFGVAQISYEYSTRLKPIDVNKFEQAVIEVIAKDLIDPISEELKGHISSAFPIGFKHTDQRRQVFLAVFKALEQVIKNERNNQEICKLPKIDR